MSKPLQPLIRWTIFTGVRLLLAFFRAIPYRACVALGAFLGRSAYHVLGPDRRRALANISIAFPGLSATEQSFIAKKMFENFGRGFAELARMDHLRPRLESFVSIEGLHHVDDALRKGKGLVWITAHIGNWELMAAAFAARGYPVNVVARPLYDPRINALLARFREENGVHAISRGDVSSAKEIFRSLKKNGFLGLLIDQDTRVQGVFVDFFGKKAFTPRGAADIAMRAGCPVIAGFIHRNPDGTHRVTIHPPLPVEITGEWERDVMVNTQAFTRVIEEEIKKAPSEWVWLHKRWHRRPPADRSIPLPGAS